MPVELPHEEIKDTSQDEHMFLLLQQNQHNSIKDFSDYVSHSNMTENLFHQIADKLESDILVSDYKNIKKVLELGKRLDILMDTPKNTFTKIQCENLVNVYWNRISSFVGYQKTQKNVDIDSLLQITDQIKSRSNMLQISPSSKKHGDQKLTEKSKTRDNVNEYLGPKSEGIKGFGGLLDYLLKSIDKNTKGLLDEHLGVDREEVSYMSDGAIINMKSTNQVLRDIEYMLYPNPCSTKGGVNFDMPEDIVDRCKSNSLDIDVIVYDMSGREVIHNKLSDLKDGIGIRPDNKQLHIDTELLASGAYIMDLVDMKSRSRIGKQGQKFVVIS